MMAQSLEEARSSDHGLSSKARVADFGVAQHTHNFAGLKKALEELIVDQNQ